jgi:hypothetical protein
MQAAAQRSAARLSEGVEAMALSPEHRRFLIVDQGVGAAVVNFLLNGGIAWLLFHSMAHVPLWGQSSIAGDTIATAFLLPLLTCLIVTRVVRRQIAGGRVSSLAATPASAVLQSLASLSTLRRGVFLGLGGVVFAAIPTILWFATLGPPQLSQESFLWFKASFAAVLAVGFTPLIGGLALMAPPSEGQPAGPRGVAPHSRRR